MGKKIMVLGFFIIFIGLEIFGLSLNIFLDFDLIGQITVNPQLGHIFYTSVLDYTDFQKGINWFIIGFLVVISGLTIQTINNIGLFKKKPLFTT